MTLDFMTLVDAPRASADPGRLGIAVAQRLGQALCDAPVARRGPGHLPAPMTPGTYGEVSFLGQTSCLAEWTS